MRPDTAKPMNFLVLTPAMYLPMPFRILKTSQIHGPLDPLPPPRGIAAQFSEPQVMYNSLIENGVEHIGMQHSFVFHAKSESAARAFRDTFVDSNLGIGGKKYDEPQGVPDTTCTVTPLASGIRYDCLVVHGNYVGYTTNNSETSQANDEETKRKVSQKTASQYLIFKQNISLPHKR